MKNPLTLLCLGLIKTYQIGLSPLLGRHCRYSPSCSHYTAASIQEHGVIKGMAIGIKRIARCHPWGGQGYDPVPKKQEGKNATTKL